MWWSCARLRWTCRCGGCCRSPCGPRGSFTSRDPSSKTRTCWERSNWQIHARFSSFHLLKHVSSTEFEGLSESIRLIKQHLSRPSVILFFFGEASVVIATAGPDAPYMSVYLPDSKLYWPRMWATSEANNIFLDNELQSGFHIFGLNPDSWNSWAELLAQQPVLPSIKPQLWPRRLYNSDVYIYICHSFQQSIYKQEIGPVSAWHLFKSAHTCFASWNLLTVLIICINSSTQVHIQRRALKAGHAI